MILDDLCRGEIGDELRMDIEDGSVLDDDEGRVVGVELLWDKGIEAVGVGCGMTGDEMGMVGIVSVIGVGKTRSGKRS